MKVTAQRDGNEYQLTIDLENFATPNPPRSLFVACNHNQWCRNNPAYLFPKMPHASVNSYGPLVIKLPADIESFEFKVFDQTCNCWCEPNGYEESVYKNMGQYLIANDYQALNVCIELSELVNDVEVMV